MNESTNPQPVKQFAQWIVHWRWPVLIASLVLAMMAAAGAPRLAFNNDYRVFFSNDNPELQAFEALQRTYTKIDNILFAVAPIDGTVFTPDILNGIETLTAESWKLPFVLRVDSITNHQHTTSTEDDLIVADLVEGGLQFSSEELESARQVALNEPFLRNYLVSENGAVTGVNVTFQMPEKT